MNPTETDVPLLPIATGPRIVAGNIAKAMAAHVQRTGVSQVVLAKRVGVSQPTISRWADGTHMPSSGQAVALAAALAITVDVLLLGDEAGA